jgi:hypothetical protein
MLRLFFGRTLGREKCRELLQTARDAAAARLNEYEGLLAQLSAAEGDTPDWPFIQVTIRAGIHHSRSTMTWAEESLTALSLEEGRHEARNHDR